MRAMKAAAIAELIDAFKQAHEDALIVEGEFGHSGYLPEDFRQWIGFLDGLDAIAALLGAEPAKYIHPCASLGHEWGYWFKMSSIGYPKTYNRMRTCRRCLDEQVETITEDEFYGPSDLITKAI